MAANSVLLFSFKLPLVALKFKRIFSFERGNNGGHFRIGCILTKYHVAEYSYFSADFKLKTFL